MPNGMPGTRKKKTWIESHVSSYCMDAIGRLLDRLNADWYNMVESRLDSIETAVLAEKGIKLIRYYLNMETDNRLALVSRPRRFGKTYAAQMLKTYYTIGYNTTFLFKNKEIFRMDPGLTHMGEFDVIYIDMLKVRIFAMDEQKKMDRMAAAGKKGRRKGLTG